MYPKDWLSERMFRDMHQEITTLSDQNGSKVLKCDDEVIVKIGRRVRPSEATALRLVREHTDVPVPEFVGGARYEGEGRLIMGVVPGVTLAEAWDKLSNTTKRRVCEETWEMIGEIRQIKKPRALQHRFLCLADGSPCVNDPLVAGARCAEPPHPPLLDDDAVRARIYECYYYAATRRKYGELPVIPRSNVSVFTHNDINPENIMFDKESCQITGIIDWEMAGWYPDYWEYASILKPTRWEDWQEWMDQTAPEKWDLSGIMAVRRVLF